MRAELGNLATLIKAKMPNTIKRVLVGRDNEPKQSDLPQIQIYPESTEVNLSGTVRDNQTRVITIRVIDSVKSKLSQSSTSLSTISSLLSVCDFMEKKESSGAFSTTSVLGILRNNPTVNGQALYGDSIIVNYSDLEALGFPCIVADAQIQLQSRNLTT